MAPGDSAKLLAEDVAKRPKNYGEAHDADSAARSRSRDCGLF